ncbi:MAG TPA: FkbM family methyltransferase [Aliidongia sp.]|nr:FkbM family methyltransferase [Aliidongia sp.]
MVLVLTSRPSARHAVRVQIASFLGRALAAQDGRARGVRRLWVKLVKVLFFALHQRLGLPSPARLMLPHGRSIAVDCADTAFLQHARVARAGECYEPPVTALLELLAPLLGTVYYVGTNWGYYAVLLASNAAFRGGIECFEINPSSFRMLERVVAGAGIEKSVTLHAFGLSDRSGTVRMSLEKHSVLTRILAETDDAEGVSARVERLDDLGLPPPDLLKLDVEGHEAPVFAGALAQLRAAAPFIIFETGWRDDEAGMLTPLRMIEAEGYELFRPLLSGGRLEAVPFRSAERAGMKESFDILAVPSRRRAQLLALADA